MTRRVLIGSAVLALTLAAASAFAHDHFRVIGTITRHQESSISVKDRNAKTTVVRLDKQTKVTKDKKKMELADLKVGASVVVEAYGDSEADLLALDVAIVPPIGAEK